MDMEGDPLTRLCKEEARQVTVGHLDIAVTKIGNTSKVRGEMKAAAAQHMRGSKGEGMSREEEGNTAEVGMSVGVGKEVDMGGKEARIVDGVRA